MGGIILRLQENPRKIKFMAAIFERFIGSI